MPAHIQSVEIPRQTVTRPIRQAAESAIIYTVLCTAYIFFSGRLAARIAETPQQLHAIETFKGVAFIILTGILFFAVSFMRWSKIRKQELALIKEETTLLQAEKKIVAAMSASMVAHDLNNLLMSLNGFLEKVKSKEQDDSTLVAMSEHIEINIAKLRHLARRLETGVCRAMSSKKENIDMKDALNEMASIVRTHPAARSCRISTSDIAPLTLTLNRTYFEEAVLNLLINAAQATGPGGQIDLRLTPETDTAVLAVHDNGPGVPDFLVHDIFEPCFTTKPGGTGIGLLAVSAFAESCGATLSIDRSPLGGAVFQLRIPIPIQSAKQDSKARLTSRERACR